MKYKEKEDQQQAKGNFQNTSVWREIGEYLVGHSEWTEDCEDKELRETKGIHSSRYTA